MLRHQHSLQMVHGVLCTNSNALQSRKHVRRTPHSLITYRNLQTCQAHSAFFDHLVELVPARYYHDLDADRVSTKYMKKGDRDVAKAAFRKQHKQVVGRLKPSELHTHLNAHVGVGCSCSRICRCTYPCTLASALLSPHRSHVLAWAHLCRTRGTSWTREKRRRRWTCSGSWQRRRRSIEKALAAVAQLMRTQLLQQQRQMARAAAALGCASTSQVPPPLRCSVCSGLLHCSQLDCAQLDCKALKSPASDLIIIRLQPMPDSASREELQQRLAAKVAALRAARHAEERKRQTEAAKRFRATNGHVEKKVCALGSKRLRPETQHVSDGQQAPEELARA
jgi:60S ribosome biogenesis protein Rrp14